MPSVLSVVIGILVAVFSSGAMFSIGFAARQPSCSPALSR